MTYFVSAEREVFWQDLIARFDRRARAYCRRTRCSEDEVEDILWDLWQEAAEHEQMLILSRDPWPVLRDLLRELCATRVRSWRRDLSLGDQTVEVWLTGDEDSPEEVDI